MSPGDDTPIGKGISTIETSNVNMENNWRNKQSNQNDADTRNHKSNGHARNGNANGYKNGGTGTENNMVNGGGRRDSTHVWSPLLQKDVPPSDETDIYNASNNNEWKESEEINNLRNSMHKSHGNNNGSLMNGKNGIGIIDKIAEQDPLTGLFKPDDSQEVSNCGIGSCRPKWLRKFASTHMFMVVFLTAWVLQGMYYTYFVSSITTIEKLFQIKSKITGMLMSATEIGQICTAMLLTYFVGRGHRPRWIALGMVLFAIASFGLTLPHFIFGEHLLATNERLQINKPEMVMINGTAYTNNSNLNLCYADSLSNQSSEVCEEKDRLEQAAYSEIKPIVLTIFFISLLSAGVGQTAVSTLGIPYIDDNVASRESPIYIAITIGVRILGPAAGFLLGWFCMGQYIDLSNPGISVTDPRWVGAWWLGLVLISTLMILTSIAMFTFPKNLRGNRIPPPAKARAIEEQRKIQQEEEEKPRLRDFPKTVRRQLKNDILMFRTASSVFHLLPVAGLYTFLPKYIETQFRLPTPDANMYAGVCGILVMGIGIILSGFVILKFNPTARSVAGWIAFTAIVYSAGMAILMFVGCSMDDFAGLKRNESTSIVQFELPCNLTCSCDFDRFSPICGLDGKTYFSSCHAGCSASNTTGGKTLYSDCKCISDYIENSGFEATAGYCDGNCKSFILFISLFAFFVFMHSTSEVGSILLIMRCTDPKDKTMAMGIIQSAIGLFGNVPCSIIYGAVVDSACLVWQTVCDKPGACSLYDVDVFRRFFLGTTSGIMLLAFFMDLVVWHKAHRIDIAPESKDTEEQIEPEPETEIEKSPSVPESSV